MRDTKNEKFPQRWRVFWFAAALVAMAMVASVVALRITDPEKLIPLALSTVLYGALAGFLSKALATALWRRRKADGAHPSGSDDGHEQAHPR